MIISALTLDALRAFVTRDVEQYDSLMEQLAAEAREDEFSAAVAAGFIVAVQEQFDANPSRADVISMVADLRSRSAEVSANLDPRAAERLILAVTHGENVDDLDGRTVVSHELALATVIVNDRANTKNEIEEFIERVRNFIEVNS